jgi:hypothetical protein
MREREREQRERDEDDDEREREREKDGGFREKGLVVGNLKSGPVHCCRCRCGVLWCCVVCCCVGV